MWEFRLLYVLSNSSSKKNAWLGWWESLIMAAVRDVDVFNGGLGCACDGRGSVLHSLLPIALLCIEIAGSNHNATSQNPFSSTSVAVLLSWRFLHPPPPSPFNLCTHPSTQAAIMGSFESDALLSFPHGYGSHFQHFLHYINNPNGNVKDSLFTCFPYFCNKGRGSRGSIPSSGFNSSH